VLPDAIAGAAESRIVIPSAPSVVSRAVFMRRDFPRAVRRRPQGLVADHAAVVPDSKPSKNSGSPPTSKMQTPIAAGT